MRRWGFTMRTKLNGKYIDPSIPGLAYQLAYGARSVWADMPQPRKEARQNG